MKTQQTTRPAADPRAGQAVGIPPRHRFEEWLRSMPVVDRREPITINVDLTLTAEAWHDMAGFCLYQRCTLNAAIAGAIDTDETRNYFGMIGEKPGITGTAKEGGAR